MTFRTFIYLFCCHSRLFGGLNGIELYCNGLVECLFDNFYDFYAT